MMQTAFNTSGKLTGAQNVGYFFSDGKPTTGQEIGTADETALKNFLDANNIKNYAIGLGSGVSNANLDPLAYDGISHTNTNAVVVPTSISSTRCCPALWKVRQSPVRCWARAVRSAPMAASSNPSWSTAPPTPMTRAPTAARVR
jgi:hypothetical protein